MPYCEDIHMEKTKRGKKKERKKEKEKREKGDRGLEKILQEMKVENLD